MDWAANRILLQAMNSAAKLFLPDGKAPKAVDMHAQPLLAERYCATSQRTVLQFLRRATWPL